MKTFVIINGKTLICIEAKDMEYAKMRAENMADHSKEIIVREIDSVLGTSTLLEANTVRVKIKKGQINLTKSKI